MNAKELLIFLQLRTCNRAQWEIQYIANEMLKQLRNMDRMVNGMFDAYGPSCYVQGTCPEGRMCCGEQDRMREKYFPSFVNQDIGCVEKNSVPSEATDEPEF